MKKLPANWYWYALAGAVGVRILYREFYEIGDGDGDVGDVMVGGEQISKYFTRGELDPYREATPEQLQNLKELAALVLDPLRAALGAKLSVTPHGGLNGPSVDQKRIDQGRGLRASTSQHRKGKAADVRKPASMSYDQFTNFVCNWIAGLPPALRKRIGLGIYNPADGFLHLDLGGQRGKKTRMTIQHF